MNEASGDCLRTGYEDLIDALTLPDLDDRHVLAAAVRAVAEVIAEPSQPQRLFRLVGFRLINISAAPGRFSGGT